MWIHKPLECGSYSSHTVAMITEPLYHENDNSVLLNHLEVLNIL